MTLDGGKLRFAHKSMIDFFAAAYVASDLGGRQPAFLEKLYDGKQLSRLSEMLRFCADLDYLTFRKTILRKLAQEIVDFEPEQRAKFSMLPTTEDSERFPAGELLHQSRRGNNEVERRYAQNPIRAEHRQ